jgi:hypothetical protein
MRLNQLTYTILAANLFLAPPPLAHADETMNVVDLFIDICASYLPGFEESGYRMEQLGFARSSRTGTESEFYNRQTGNRAYLDLKKGQPSCSIDAERKVQRVSFKNAEYRLKEVFGDEVHVWRYNGRVAGWSIPYKESVLYVIAEADSARKLKGLGVEVRHQSD